MSESTRSIFRMTPSGLSAFSRPSVLSILIKQMADTVASQIEVSVKQMTNTVASKIEASEQINASRMDLCSVTRLITLNRSLQTQELYCLGNEVQRNLIPSTISTINAMESNINAGKMMHTLNKAQVTSAIKDMTSTIQQAHQALAFREQKTICDDISSILLSRGYTIRVEEIQATRLIRAKKNDLVISARVANDGTMEMDMAGFEPGKCTQERETIIQQLNNQGYLIDVQQQTIHNRRDGGVIVKEIEKQFKEIDDRFRRLNLARAQQSRKIRKG